MSKRDRRHRHEREHRDRRHARWLPRRVDGRPFGHLAVEGVLRPSASTARSAATCRATTSRRSWPRSQPLIPADVHKRLRKLVASVPWTTKLSMLLAADGWRDAGLFDADYDPHRQAVVVAGHNLNALYQFNSRIQFEEEPDFIDGMTSLYSLDTDHAGCVSEVLQARGPIYTVGAACASGNVSLRAAVDEIRHHGAQVAMVVGAVLEFAPIDVHAMALMGAIAFQHFNDEPARASRPYDTRREGFVPAHGGATLVLEELDAAKRRGARIYAEVLGCAANSDGNHLPQPSEDGQAHVMSQRDRRAPAFVLKTWATSTRTPPRRRSAISPSCGRSSACSATTRNGCASTRRSRCSGTAAGRRRRWKPWPACSSCAPAACIARSTSTSSIPKWTSTCAATVRSITPPT